MTSYGMIYCESLDGNRIVKYFDDMIKDNETIERLRSKSYERAIRISRSLGKKEPNQCELKSIYRAADEYLNQLLKKPISESFKDVAICSVSNFDESAFQLSIVRNGDLLTLHQIGEELKQMGMEEKRGDAGIIASFFDVPHATASEFVLIDEPIDAEEMFFSAFAP